MSNSNRKRAKLAAIFASTIGLIACGAEDEQIDSAAVGQKNLSREQLTQLNDSRFTAIPEAVRSETLKWGSEPMFHELQKSYKNALAHCENLSDGGTCSIAAARRWQSKVDIMTHQERKLAIENWKIGMRQSAVIYGKSCLCQRPWQCVNTVINDLVKVRDSRHDFIQTAEQWGSVEELQNEVGAPITRGEVFRR